MVNTINDQSWGKVRLIDLHMAVNNCARPARCGPLRLCWQPAGRMMWTLTRIHTPQAQVGGQLQGGLQVGGAAHQRQQPPRPPQR